MDSIRLISPSTCGILRLENEKYVSTLTGESFPFEKNVVRFLSKEDGFYEGAYLNKIKYIPFSEKWPFIFPIWLIGCGYLWEVRKQFKPGASLVELGCAGGVDYFGKRFNMIGLDLSFQSLSHLTGYRIGLQANATSIPLPNESVDGVVSSFFWEHIDHQTKDLMLKEFARILRPGGKVVFLYDVATDNQLISILKNRDSELYETLFLKKDGHVGYESPTETAKLFQAHRFDIVKHFGMERTIFQSSSVYVKLSVYPGVLGLVGKILNLVTSTRLTTYFNIFFIRVLDETVGRLFSLNKSRIMLSVLKKRAD